MIIKQHVNQDEGFVRSSIEEVRGNLLEALKTVVLAGKRIVLQQAGEEVAAIIPVKEFERLEYLEHELVPPIWEPYEEEYYEDEGGIHCVLVDEMEAEFDEIITEVTVYKELFGLLPPQHLSGKEFDTFAPVAIVMNIDKFWVSEYWISEKDRLKAFH
ncbi:Phd_YefM [Rivularia sp. PCC 7116]|uniref:type II toxin-antitoxin system Phd/YefM family antitoxin n=1 Tax=Rivularia sp. PCC 7116 TaxID=373994 RepID=UPI00029F26CA|nr:type II toxin-antitoxin system Phd/YefM family antitoxin [Rivularia sp. PCC 7116]AFY54130.1 Phd_YefM [Rivularia sp. PCC 7116]